MKRFIPIVVLVVFTLAALSLPLWADKWLDDRQASVQTATVLVLIAVTAYYAWQSRQQAEASRRMVDEMELQRLDAVQPELVLCQTNPGAKSTPVDFKQVLPVQDTIDLRGTIPIMVHNFGVGLARDIVSKVLVEGQASPDVPLPPLAPEFWTGLDLSSHQTWLECKRTKEFTQQDIPDERRGKIPRRVDIELRYRDTFGWGHRTTVQLEHDDHRGDYFYAVKSTEYRHRYSADSRLN